MSLSASRTRRVPAIVFTVSIYLGLVASLWAAGRFTHALLFEQAADIVDIWVSGATPFDVHFDNPEALISRSSQGIDNATISGDGLSVSSDGSSIALALRLPHGGLMRKRLASVSLQGASSLPASWQLIAFSPAARQSTTIASSQLGADGAVSQSPLAFPDWPVSALQLRLDAATGSRIQLTSVRFMPDFTPDPDARCYYGREPYGWEGCSRRTVRLVSYPESALGDTLMRSDSDHELFPGLAIEPAESSNIIDNSTSRAMQVWLHLMRGDKGLAAIYGVVIALAVLSLLLAYRYRGDPSRFGMVALPLLLAAILLPATGLPDNTPRPYLVAVFGAWLLAALLVGSRSPALRWLGDRKAWREAALFSFAALCLLLVLGSRQKHAPGMDEALRYLPWVALQQWLLQRLIRPAWESWSSRTATVLAGSGLLFALMHFPNTALMSLSAIGAIGWCWLGQRNRALMPLILSHWLLGLAALTLLSPSLLRNAEIGSRFLMMR